MTFEEFFKKKRIDLGALEKAEPALFSEFKTHYEKMGEKSFDHTKKFWFNKLRLQYLLPPEVKTEKPVIENQLAEQTVAESLTGPPAPSSPKLGFIPKFKAASLPKPATTEEKKEEQAPPAATDENTAAKPAYKPRFNIKNIPPKPPTD